jgi:queuine tRNA-ribosyltransferase
LFASQEPLGLRLATMHNLQFYLRLMQRIRDSIEAGNFGELVKKFTDKTV